MATHKPVRVDELFGDLTASDKGDKWQVIHTKPQCEKKMAEYLRSNGISYYLPLLDSVRHYEYRKVTFTKPMFPGYLFARFDSAAKTHLLLSGYIVKLLKVSREAELLEELRSIRLGREHSSAIAKGVWLDKGWQVEIASGPLKGLKGIVQNQSHLSEVSLQVSILRQAVSVRVKSSDVRIISVYEQDPTGQGAD